MSAKDVLENIRVASPCQESWEGMNGTDRVRACERCQHKVYNLSEMNAAEAADVIRKAEGRLCVRFYRRADGTIMTKDCPVGVANKNKKYKRSLALVTATAGIAVGATLYPSQKPWVTVVGGIDSAPVQPQTPSQPPVLLLIPTESHTETSEEARASKEVVMGKIAVHAKVSYPSPKVSYPSPSENHEGWTAGMASMPQKSESSPPRGLSPVVREDPFQKLP